MVAAGFPIVALLTILLLLVAILLLILFKDILCDRW